MNVTNLDSVVFGVTDLGACRRFWNDFGLAEATAADGATVFSCKNGSTVVLRSADDPQLPQPIEAGATQREAIFGVKAAADLDAIATELERDRPVRIDADGTLHTVDPLGFGMLGSRAMALMALGRHDEAAAAALQAAARPNAHVHIQSIAMHCLALAGRLDEAGRFAAAIARAQPGYSLADFLTAFRFSPDRAALVREGARRLGMT